MPRYQRHVFICTNERPPDNPKGCCASKGGGEVRALFKRRLKEMGLNRIVRANAAGCLDACALGITVVIYPEAVWYGGVTAEDVEEIIAEHVVGGRVVKRLVMPRLDGGPDRFPPLALPAPGDNP